MPTSIDQILRKAKSLLKRGKLDLAIQQYESILQKYPENRAAKNALRDLRACASSKLSDDNFPAPLIAKGTSLYSQGKLSEAESIYSQILNSGIENPEVLCNLGLIKKSEGDVALAEKYMRRAIAVQPDYIAAHHNLAHILSSKGNIIEAEAHLLKVLAIKSNVLPSIEALAKIYLQSGKPVKAEALIRQAIRIDDENPVFFSYLGLSLKLQRNYSDAVQAYLKAISKQPEEPAHYSNLGNCYTSMRQNHEALDCYKKSIALNPEFIDGYVNLSNYYETLYKDKGLVEARDVLLRGIKQSGGSDKLYAKIARIYSKQREYDLALKAANNSIMLNPASLDAYLALYEIYADKCEYGKSYDSAKLAYEIQPGNPDTQIAYATACLHVQKYTESIPLLDAYLSDPFTRHAEALAFKTIALRELGRDREADEITNLDNFVYVSDLGIPREFSSVEEFNSALEAGIKSHSTLEKSPSGFVARNCYLTNDLQEPLFKKLEVLLKKKIEEYIAQLPSNFDHSFLSDIPSEYFLRIWGTLSSNEGYIDSHIHREGWLSAAYYLKLPASIEAGGTEGWIEFGEPPSQLCSKATYPTLKIKPEIGKIILFPSYYYHRTIPYSSRDERMSISFDLNITRFKQKI